MSSTFLDKVRALFQHTSHRTHPDAEKPSTDVYEWGADAGYSTGPSHRPRFHPHSAAAPFSPLHRQNSDSDVRVRKITQEQARAAQEWIKNNFQTISRALQTHGSQSLHHLITENLCYVESASSNIKINFDPRFENDRSKGFSFEINSDGKIVEIKGTTPEILYTGQDCTRSFSSEYEAYTRIAKHLNNMLQFLQNSFTPFEICSDEPHEMETRRGYFWAPGATTPSAAPPAYTAAFGAAAAFTPPTHRGTDVREDSHPTVRAHKNGSYTVKIGRTIYQTQPNNKIHTKDPGEQKFSFKHLDPSMVRRVWDAIQTHQAQASFQSYA